MARLAPSELAEVLEFLTPRPWVRPLAGIAAPGGIVPFVRHQLGDVRVDDRGWIATAPWEGIAVTGTPRLGVLAQPAVIPWGDVARFLRPDLPASRLGLSASPDRIQSGLFRPPGVARLRVSIWPARKAQVRLGGVSTPPGDPVADPPVSPGHIAPSLAEEPADDVLRATPDFATASRMFEPGSSRRRAFNTYSMHAIARDPKAMRGFLIASGMNLDTPASEIISRGWQAFVPEVRWHIAVEVLVPAWLARAAPDFSDPRIWTATPRG